MAEDGVSSDRENEPGTDNLPIYLPGECNRARMKYPRSKQVAKSQDVQSSVNSHSPIKRKEVSLRQLLDWTSDPGKFRVALETIN